MLRSFTSILVLAAALSAAPAVPGPAFADSSVPDAQARKPGSDSTLCNQSRRTVTSRYGQDKSTCHRRAKRDRVPVSQACLDRAKTRFDEAMAKVNADSICTAIAYDRALWLTAVDEFVDSVVALDPCAAKIGASGVLAKAMLQCQGRVNKLGAAGVETCQNRAKAKLEKAFVRADAKGCTPTGGAQTVQAQATTMVNNIGAVRLFATAQLPNGAVGSRAATNAVCAARAVSQGLTCGTVVSLLSYTGDVIRDFPTTKSLPANAPVVAGTQQVAASWADFLDGSWSTCLGTECKPAGVTPAGIFPNTTGVFSGSANDGSLAANCNDWTSATSSATVIYGECYGSHYAEHFGGCAAGQTFATPSGTVYCGAPLIHLCLCY